MKNQGQEVFRFDLKGGGAMIRRWDDKQQFTETFSSFWLTNEAENIAFLRLGTKSVVGNFFCFSVHDELENIQQTAFLDPSDQIIISNGPEWATKALCHLLADNRIDVPGIFAPVPAGHHGDNSPDRGRPSFRS